MDIALSVVLAYLFGSIPTGLLVAYVLRLGDIRAIGSGNIGATNVLRSGSRLAAFLTLLGDMLKGFLPVFLAMYWGNDIVQHAFVGLAAILGHIFPVWLKFRGGKGVATFIGIQWALSWPLGIIALMAWLCLALGSRISSVGGMGMTMIVCVSSYFLGISNLYLAINMVMSIIVIWRHNGNIKRIWQGCEPRIRLRNNDNRE